MRRTRTVLSRPAAIADPESIVKDNGGRQVSFASLPDRYRRGAFAVTVDTGGAAIGATAVPVVALKEAISKGRVLRFSATKFATVSADVAAGATSLPVEALLTALVAGDVTYTGGEGNKKYVPPMTVMVEIAAGAEAGKMVPRAVRPAAETAYGFIETGADEDSDTDAISGYGMIIGGVIYENLLPDSVAGDLPSAYKTELQAAGTGFAFKDYEDSRDQMGQ
jgi:hypothetical protein